MQHWCSTMGPAICYLANVVVVVVVLQQVVVCKRDNAGSRGLEMGQQGLRMVIETKKYLFICRKMIFFGNWTWSL